MESQGERQRLYIARLPGLPLTGLLIIAPRRRSSHFSAVNWNGDGRSKNREKKRREGTLTPA